MSSEQFHRNQHGTVEGPYGEGAHISDDERTDIDGRTEQPQHQVLRGEVGPGCAGTALEGVGGWPASARRVLDTTSCVRISNRLCHSLPLSLPFPSLGQHNIN
jgi:hypothetical protein